MCNAHAGPPQRLTACSPLENSVSFQVSVLAKLLDRRLARLVMDRFDLTVAEYRVLAQIMLYPGSTVRAIAERTYVDKAQVSRAAAALEAEAYITRDMLDHDRRSPVFTVTRTGRALLNRLIPLRQAQEAELAAGLRPGRAGGAAHRPARADRGARRTGRAEGGQGRAGPQAGQGHPAPAADPEGLAAGSR